MKKNNEEIKERLMKARALSDEELEKVAGGEPILGQKIFLAGEYVLILTALTIIG